MRAFLNVSAALALAAGCLSAAPVGTVTFTNASGGGVTITSTGFDFTLPTGGSVGDVAIGGATNVTFSTGTITSATNPFGQVKDFSLSGVPVSNFLSFYTSPSQPSPAGTGALLSFPVFDLASVSPGGSAAGALNDCAGVTAIGVSCSPLLTPGPFVSPLILTNRGAYTDVSVGFVLTGRDASGSASWTGGVTAQVTGMTPSQIQALLKDGGLMTSTYSATFVNPGRVIINEVPEPGTMALAGAGLIALAAIARRRK